MDHDIFLDIFMVFYGVGYGDRSGAIKTTLW